MWVGCFRRNGACKSFRFFKFDYANCIRLKSNLAFLLSVRNIMTRQPFVKLCNRNATTLTLFNTIPPALGAKISPNFLSFCQLPQNQPFTHFKHASQSRQTSITKELRQRRQCIVVQQINSAGLGDWQLARKAKRRAWCLYPCPVAHATRRCS